MEYEDILSDALGSLKERRDEAVESLEAARDLVRTRIGDAIDALYGRRMIHSHLGAFLEQCDVKTTALLKRYRDENRAARSDDPPAHFDDSYRFPPFADSDGSVEDGDKRRVEAEQKIDAVERIVDEAVAAIHSAHDAALDEYSDLDTLIGVDMQDKASLRRADTSQSGSSGAARPAKSTIERVA